MREESRRTQMEQFREMVESDRFYVDATGYKIEWGWGKAGRIMFIGQCPAQSNWMGKRGDSDFDKAFLNLLKPLKIDPEKFYFTNVVKIPVKMEVLPDYIFERNARYLYDEIQIVNPKIIIALGRYAKDALGLIKVNFFSIPHPGSIRYGNISEDNWRKNLKEIIRTYKSLKRK